MRSGRVLFGDPVTEYINEVADQLLANNKQLRSELRFYTIKSPEVNAFATNQGIIFVSLGLMAQVRNEAELAFVLAHEITHYEQEHVISSHVELELKAKSRDFKNKSLQQQLKELNSYSQEHEYEADELGFERILKSDYDAEAATGVFDVLIYSYLPFDEVRFDSLFFDSEQFSVNKQAFRGEAKPITVIEDYDDSKSSHPNIKKRRERVLEMLDNSESAAGKKKFLLGKERFETIRTISRFELSDIYLKNMEYEKAIYNSYLLLRTYPENQYLNTNVAKALYSIANYNSGKDYKISEVEYYKIVKDKNYSPSIHYRSSRSLFAEGEISILKDFLLSCKDEELAVLAAKQSWECYTKYGNVHSIGRYAKQSIKDLVFFYQFEYDSFSNFDYALYQAQFVQKIQDEEEDEEEEVEEDKYSKISKKREKKKEVVARDLGYLYGAFLPVILSNADLHSAFKEYKEEYDEEVRKADKLKTLSVAKKKALLVKYNKEVKKKAKRSEETGYQVFKEPVPNGILISPFYKYTKRHYMEGKHPSKYKKTKDLPIEAEKKKEELAQTFKDVAQEMDYDLTVLDYEYLEENEVEDFNNLSVYRDWILEVFSHKKQFEVYSNQDEVVRLARDVMGSEHLFLSGTDYIRYTNKPIFLMLVYSLYVPPMILYAIYEAFYTSYSTDFSLMAVNVNTGAVSFLVNQKFDSQDREEYRRAQLYNILHNMRKGKLN